MLGDDPRRLLPPHGARRPLLTSGGQMHVQGPPKVLVPYPCPPPRGPGQTAQVTRRSDRAVWGPRRQHRAPVTMVRQ